MFDFFAMVLSSLASVLFPIFASYKALKTSDPAQLTPWLMYWVVLNGLLLVESYLNFILTWVPFYGYLRLLFLLYLILPQTQGARIIYEEHVHPFLEEHENHIDEFISSAHERLKKAGIAYLKQAIEAVKTNVLGLPPTEPAPEPSPYSSASGVAQSYTQSLLARFSVPTARWSGSPSAPPATNPNSAAGHDFYNLLASAVSAVTAPSTSGNTSSTTARGELIPSSLRDTGEKITFIAAQRERLSILLSALDREAQDIQRDAAASSDGNNGTKSTERTSRSMAFDGNSDEEPTQRPPSGLSMWSALSKSRSEVDFEKIEAESGAEEDPSAPGSGAKRRRGFVGGDDGNTATPNANAGSWMPWGWGSSTPAGQEGSATPSGQGGQGAAGPGPGQAR